MKGDRRKDFEALTEPRPAIAESKAILDAAALSRDVKCPVHICHLLSEKG